MAKMSEQQADDFMRRFKFILIALAVIVVAPIIGLIFYLNWRFNEVQDSLRYRAPASADHHAAVLDALPWEPVQGQTVYVPAYSHVYHQNGDPVLLTVTLSVRNADPVHELVLTSIRYFDTKGKEVRSHLDKPLRLGPMASTEFLVERDDASGGSGANFLVEWVAGEPIVPPVIETVMINASGTQGISFARAGTIIKERSSPAPAAP